MASNMLPADLYEDENEDQAKEDFGFNEVRTNLFESLDRFVETKLRLQSVESTPDLEALPLAGHSASEATSVRPKSDLVFQDKKGLKHYAISSQTRAIINIAVVGKLLGNQRKQWIEKESGARVEVKEQRLTRRLIFIHGDEKQRQEALKLIEKTVFDPKINNIIVLKERYCSNCLDPRHVREECERCYRCLDVGHYQRQCPSLSGPVTEALPVSRQEEGEALRRREANRRRQEVHGVNKPCNQWVKIKRHHIPTGLVLAMDVEMGKTIGMPSVASAVNIQAKFPPPCRWEVVYHNFVNNSDRIVDCNEVYGGAAAPEVLAGSSPDEVKREVLEILRNRVVYMHTHSSDFTALGITRHEIGSYHIQVRDLAEKHRKPGSCETIKLRDLSYFYHLTCSTSAKVRKIQEYDERKAHHDIVIDTMDTGRVGAIVDKQGAHSYAEIKEFILKAKERGDLPKYV